MVTSPQLPDAVLQRIASQIAERVPLNSELDAPGAIAGLGESLKVAVLPQNQINDGDGSLQHRVIETGQWHHQIYAADGASSFARSTEEPEAPGFPADVVEVAESTIADDLRQTIAWVDEPVQDDGTAEVLIAPSHFLTSLWLKGPDLDAVVISSAPPEMEGLGRNELIPSDRFLQMLANTPAVEGLGLPDEDEPPLGADA